MLMAFPKIYVMLRLMIIEKVPSVDHLITPLRANQP